MAFKITKDLVENGKHEGRIRHLAGEIFTEADLTIKFKLYDDDGELYYKGVTTDGPEEIIFAPLDWAAWNAGCTYMKVKNDKGKWEVL